MKSPWLWGILMVALAARAPLLVGVYQDANHAFGEDSHDYVSIAEHLAGYAALAGSVRDGSLGSAEVFRTPGYPAAMAAARVALGPPSGKGWVRTAPGVWTVRADPMGPAIKGMLAAQILIDLHLVLLTYLLGRRLAVHGVGLAAATFQAISPLAIATSCLVLPDGLFAFLLTAALLLVLRHLRTGGWPSLLAAAGVMGAVCYVHAAAQAFAAVMILVLLFRPKRLRRAAAFACMIAAMTAPWFVRNAVVADYAGFSSFAVEGTCWHSAAELVARRKGMPVGEVREQFRREEGWDDFDPDLVGQPGLSNAPCYRTPGGLTRYRWQRAKAVLLAHPWEYLDIHLKGCLAFWLPGAADVLEIAGHATDGKAEVRVPHAYGSPADANGDAGASRNWDLKAAVRRCGGGSVAVMWLAGAMLLVWLVRLSGVGLCVVWGLRVRIGAAPWLCVLLVAAAFLLPGPAASPSCRVPVEPILSVAAAVGWTGVLARLGRRRRDGDAREDAATQAG